MRVELQRLLREGDALLRAGSGDEAFERFERVFETIEWYPYDVPAFRALRARAKRGMQAAKSE